MRWLLVLVPVAILLTLTPVYPTLYSQASQAMAVRTGTSPFPTFPFTVTTHPNGFARITGSVVIGPTCPVENLERPCPIPDYSAFTLVLTGQGGEAINVPLAVDGGYDASVPAGTYTVTLIPCGYLGCSSVFPATAKLDTGKVTTINFSIDTGIR